MEKRYRIKCHARFDWEGEVWADSEEDAIDFAFVELTIADEATDFEVDEIEVLGDA